MVEQIEGVGVGVGEEGWEGSLGHEGEVADVFLGSWRADSGESLFVGRPEDVEDLVELINVISALEEWASAQQLS